MGPFTGGQGLIGGCRAWHAPLAWRRRRLCLPFALFAAGAAFRLQPLPVPPCQALATSLPACPPSWPHFWPTRQLRPLFGNEIFGNEKDCHGSVQCPAPSAHRGGRTPHTATAIASGILPWILQDMILLLLLVRSSHRSRMQDSATSITSEIMPSLLQAGFCHRSREQDSATALSSEMMPQLSRAR